MKLTSVKLSRLVALALLFVCCPPDESLAQDNMKPLIEIINEAKSGPDTTEGTLHLFSLIGLRCGGFFGAMGSLTGDERLAQLSMNMAQVTAVAENFGAKTNLVKALENAVEEVMSTKDLYRAIMIKNNTVNGNYFTGHPLLDGDYSACKEVMLAMLDFVKRAGIPLVK